MSSNPNAKKKQQQQQQQKSATTADTGPTSKKQAKCTKCCKDLPDAMRKIEKLNKELDNRQMDLLALRNNFDFDKVRKEMPQSMDMDGIIAELQARCLVSERDKDLLEKNKEKLQHEISELNMKVKELEEKSKAFEENEKPIEKATKQRDGNNLETLEKNKEQLERDNVQMQHDKEKQERNILELKKKINDLDEENKVLKDRQEKTHESTAVIDEQSNHINALSNQANKITKLEKENAQLTADIRAAKEQWSKLAGENKQLNEKLSTTRGQGDADLNTQLNKLTQQIGDKERELTERKETYQKDLKEKDGQIGDKERELNERKETYQKELKEKDGTIKENEDEIERLKRTIKQNEEEIERLKRDIQELKQEAKSRQTSERKGSSTEKEKGDSKKIKELENERNTLISEAKQLNSKLKDYERQVEGLKTQLEEQKKTIEKMKDAHPKSGHSKQRELEKEITALKQSLKDAQQRGGNSRETELMEEVESLKTRLSKMAGAQLMDGNPNIADLSDTNRPTKLAEQYSELYDNEWTNAFEVLEEMGKSEVDIIETLRRILMDTYKFCIEVSKEQMRQMKRALTAVANRGEEIPDENIPVVKRRQLHDLRKAFAPDLIDSVFESYKEKNKPADIGNKDMKSYVHKCISLCWLMNVQDPPVVLDTKNHSGTFNGDVFRSYTKTGKTLAFVVWPALYIEQGGAMLAKGVAQGK